jgi:hypothetical protein
MPDVLSKEDTAASGTRPLAAMTDDEKQAIQEWRRGSFLGRHLLLLAFLILSVIIITLLPTLRLWGLAPRPKAL